MSGTGQGDAPHGAHGTELAEIVVTEPLDLAGVRELGVVIDAVLKLEPPSLVIDLSGCPHVDAAGIGLLLDTHRRMWRLGGRLTLRSPSPRIWRLLQVARVDQVFQIVEEPSSSHLPRSSAPARPVGSVQPPTGRQPGAVPPAGSAGANGSGAVGVVPADDAGASDDQRRSRPAAPVARGRAQVGVPAVPR
ncbi:STAS domain-containing protein [Micromonospora sp. WMMD882]|uniref:STAS domain-containing protein n=1 Tax=Micromonospora sp. WMMD882 TaxID=3015151 RepID=UPI00248AAFFC|nr:STAS domain-containing protein [Micromonospora sp. WMMD882]WBB81082.1 STAS domain-containing protein [Micromonospora sp. WMMD882]